MAGATAPAREVTIVARGLNMPSKIVAGPDGNLWFTHGNDSIGRITPNGVITNIMATGIESPWGITAGSDGNLWFASRGNDSIGRMSPSGDLTLFTGAGISNPTSMSTGPDGNVWVTNTGTGKQSIGRITPTGAISTFAGSAIESPSSLAAGPDGNIWFTNTDGNTIGRISPQGAVSHFTSPDVATPHAITAGPDGNLWFVNVLGDSIGRVTPQGVISTFSDPGINRPLGLTTGPDGNLWFTNSYRRSIGRITPDGVVSTFTSTGIRSPEGIVAGPDGNLWFTDYDSIGRITPTGLITRFTGPGVGGVAGIASGADGNLWFTNVNTGSVGRVTTAGVIALFGTGDFSYPYRIAPAPNGTMWFTDVNHHSIRQITPGGVTTTIAGPGDGIQRPGPITPGPDGNIWFANQSNAIGYVGTGVPGPPLVVSATGDDGQATLSWSAPASDGGAPVTAYTVTASPGGQTCVWSSGPLSCTVNGLADGSASTFTVVASNTNGIGPPSRPVGMGPPLSFHPLTPNRILDSRPSGPHVGPYATPWGPGAARDVPVAGAGGVPSGADAVAVNVTVTGTTSAGYLTIWSAGQNRPLTSSLNWAPGQTIANAVTVTLGAGGALSVFNSLGQAEVIIDVVGYYDTGPAAGLTPLNPARVLDSRPAGPQVGPYATPWAPGATRDVTVTGVGGYADNADAVVLTVTVTDTSGAGFLTIWPTGQPRPVVSSLNWAPGQTIANAVTVKPGTGGKVSVFNAAGNADVIVDVIGSFTAGTGVPFHAVAPVRIQDSRPDGPQAGPYRTPWSAGASRNLRIRSVGPVPVIAVAVMLNVTVTGTSAASYLTIWPSGQPAPLTSSLNWAPGATIAQGVTAKVGVAGGISMTNTNGETDVIVDTTGWYG